MFDPQNSRKKDLSLDFCLTWHGSHSILGGGSQWWYLFSNYDTKQLRLGRICQTPPQWVVKPTAILYSDQRNDNRVVLKNLNHRESSGKILDLFIWFICFPDPAASSTTSTLNFRYVLTNFGHLTPVENLQAWHPMFDRQVWLPWPTHHKNFIWSCSSPSFQNVPKVIWKYLEHFGK